MSDRRSSSDLGSSAEAILSAFPFPERDWESNARAIEARLSDSVSGSTDALLLTPPLPIEPDEPSSLSATATPLTNSGVRTQSLAELARRSVEKKQDSLRQMARESLAIAAQQRPSNADEARSLREAVQSTRSAALPTAAGVSPIAPVVPARESARLAASNHWSKVALALPALALAAAALFWFRHPAPTVVSTAVAPAAPSAVAENRPSASQETPRGIDPNTLPGEPTPKADPMPAKVAGTGSSALTAAAKVGQSKLALKDERATVPAEPVGKSLPADPALRPADSRSGELPAKPSSGAVQAALGSVMSGARHCVAGDAAPSSAVVVFGSDGRVQHVTVSGSAAGKSSGACIEAQLGRARVQPFAASNFSVNATVRPE